MRMRGLVTLSGTVTLSLAVAGPAWAHEEITPASVPTGTPVFFNLSAANEKQVDLTKVTLTAPAGLGLGPTTKEPAGWARAATSTDIAWTGGAINGHPCCRRLAHLRQHPGSSVVSLGFCHAHPPPVNTGCLPYRVFQLRKQGAQQVAQVLIT